MHELTGRVIGVSYTFSGNPTITLEVNETEALPIAMQLKEVDKLSIKLDRFREKRSLDANAYFHLLVNKIAAKVKLSDEEVKRNMVFSYGTYARDDDGVIVGAMLPSGQDITPFYPYARCYKTDRVGGKEVDCYIFYKRTRDMNTAEFSRLVDGTVQEAQALGIETLTPAELERLKAVGV